MGNIIDCKGLNCPLPVVNTKKYFEGIEEGAATTIVDNEVAKNNVVKLAQKMGCTTKVQEKENLFYVEIIKASGTNTGIKEAKDEKFVIVIGQDKLGEDEKLGNILMKGYIFALSEADVVPTDLIFLNSGAKLTTKDSVVLDSLKKLEERNVKIQVCGTCLDFYNIKEELSIGEISNMYSIVETMNTADKVINIG